MDEFLASLIIEWYEDLEGRLADYLKSTPFIPQNLNICSPRLAGVITEACDILDSLLREVSPQTVSINGQTKNQDKLTITDYAHLYAARYNLPATKSLLFMSPPQYLIPFQSWGAIASGGPYTPPPWWTAHTKLKHERISHILNQSTLCNTVEALCGLHQVIAKRPELIQAVLRHGWLQLGGWNPEVVIEDLHQNRQRLTHTFLVETKLFAVPVGPEPFPDNIQDLHPGLYVSSERLVRFFGKWY